MYLIRYAGCCLNGLVRAGNEDNYCCAGTYPPMVHGDIPLFEGAVFPGKASAFAVFDGMGGEKYGEAASFLAAGEFAAAAGNEPDETALCRQMNRRILEFTAQRVRLDTRRGPLCVTGEGLTLCDVRRGALTVRGEIRRVELPCPEGGAPDEA